MRFLTGLIAAGVIAGFASSASAQVNGWYWGATLAESLLPKQKFSTPDVPGGKLEESNYMGWGVGTQAGYGFGNRFRAEGEVMWRTNGVNHIDNVGAANGTGRGQIENFSLMGNGYYDIPVGHMFLPTLSLGLGAGMVNVRANNVRSLSGQGFSSSNTWVPAAQVMVGELVPLSDRLQLRVEGRFQQTGAGDWTPSPTFLGTNKLKFSEHSYQILMGFIYSFDGPAMPMQMAASAPPPPPPPPPPPAPPVVQPPAPPPAAPAVPRNFQVFFDFDKSNITADARKILEMAAANAKSLKITRINATGHADRAGSEPYNMALSLRRANAVKAELVALGIPAADITVVGKGETSPLVPTADGVREPRNRRVEIVLP